MAVNLASIDLDFDHEKFPIAGGVQTFLRNHGTVSSDEAALASAVASVVGVFTLERMLYALAESVGKTITPPDMVAFFEKHGRVTE